jgi:hypothetical protein
MKTHKGIFMQTPGGYGSHGGFHQEFMSLILTPIPVLKKTG